jgi:tetratricopeptide (TPR) repeat protein
MADNRGENLMNVQNRSWLCAAAAAMLCACAGVGTQARPEDIARLERKITASPADNAARTQLGLAYYQGKRFQDARATFDKLVAEGSRDGAVYLYLGLTDEELKDYQGARGAYTKYLDVAKSASGKKDVQSRLALLARKELRDQAKIAIQREQDLSDQPPTARSVAVFPFRLVGADERLKPLQPALADMMITDLQLSGAIISVERVRVQSMLDEMLLGEGGYTTPETGARAGRLLRAETVVQGVVTAADQDQLRMDASVLNVAARSNKGDVGNDGKLAAVFDIEKKMVFGILDLLGVQLTASEREKINENRTENVLAFLAYGQGLQAADKGNYQEATRFFRQATQLDPSFGRAQQQQTETVQLQQGENVTPEKVQQVAATESPATAPATAAASSTAELAKATASDVNPSPAGNLTQGGTTNPGNNTTTGDDRHPAQEGQQQEGATQATHARITITIPRPN